MQELWLNKGPELDALVSETKDQRNSKKQDLAVIIATNRRKKILEEHLERLSKQTYRDLDIIIVYDEETEFVHAPPWSSMVHLRERGRNGSAGAFYIGEKFALQEGYNKIILADDDCFPQSEDLVERIYHELDKGKNVVVPLVDYGTFHRKSKTESIHHYGGLRKEVFKKSGLTFLPFWLGVEDIELMTRIKKQGMSLDEIKCVASHIKQNPFILRDQEILHHYTRSTIELLFLNGYYLRALLSLAGQLAFGLIWILTGRTEIGKRYFRTANSIAEMKFFFEEIREKEGPLKEENPESREARETIDKKTKSFNNPVLSPLSSFSEEAAKIRELAGRFIGSRRYFNKSIVFLDGFNSSDLAAILVSNEAHLRWKSKNFRITQKRNLLQIIAGLMAFAFSMPLLVFLSIILTAKGIWNKSRKKISTMGYGLD